MSRLAASASVWLLIVLTVLPFTAPFSSCDLSTLLVQPPAATPAGAIHRPGGVASLVDAAMADPSASFLDEQAFKGTVSAGDIGSFIGLPALPPIARESHDTSAPRLSLISLRV